MMTLYSGTTDPFSQRCRIVLHEKGMDFQIIDVDLDHKPEDLAVMNPYNQVPVLVERDLVPIFYDRKADGIPRRWMARMKAAITSLSPAYNSGSSTFSTADVRESRLKLWKTKPRVWLRFRASA